MATLIDRAAPVAAVLISTGKVSTKTDLAIKHKTKTFLEDRKTSVGTLVFRNIFLQIPRSYR